MLDFSSGRSIAHELQPLPRSQLARAVAQADAHVATSLRICTNFNKQQAARFSSCAPPVVSYAAERSRSRLAATASRRRRLRRIDREAHVRAFPGVVRGRLSARFRD
jgi:7-keto-8-aminopelargonate synthetase-like enzyme